MARFYCNENFRYSVVLELRKLGHDVLTSLEAGNANKSIPDEDVLSFSINERRILLTFNRKDFIRLHKERSTHFGILVCTDNPDNIFLANKIHELVLSQEIVNKLIRNNRPNS
ncbi:MAG TPA: DUF5615 family PIN-like protein [Leptospiraceae bacterium]|nr:DUF5615 family PIN-like protein [Leptospiraceae bacterium]HMW05760.1 DUF5615 family PIN-like protein [Leptospiraceae bacterium]HMX33856.1 DUF5615 family PIN-like protein [Leptospiraceae bacterium]HMY33365.1 DUF5615 family PIN-like protein [Leptospiraceae bacterium]HMZ65438.1 DUF5615 family PIN-like protein [Leptospiraceae bacterium]